MEKLHFDNLFDTAEVQAYWARFIENLRVETRNAATDDDAFRMLMIVGIGLHGVQDFYSHSNWAETHPRHNDNAFRTDTFLSTGATGLKLYTGKYPADRKIGPGKLPVPAAASPHGAYTSGLNKDSPIRPGWDEAYVFAYAASIELTGLFEKWAEQAKPGFWKKVREYSISADDRAKLDYDLRALRNMSMWISGKGQDGHWKGNKSGSARFFSAFSSKWVGKNSSRFVKAAAEGTLHENIAKGLYEAGPSPVLPSVPKFSLKQIAVMLRISQIFETDERSLSRRLPKRPGGTDFYARITIGGEAYWERTMQSSRNAVDPWYVIHFEDAASKSIPVKINVWDEDNTDSEKDREIDIHWARGKKFLEFLYYPNDNRLSGDFNGILSEFAATGGRGEGDAAHIKGSIFYAPLR